MTARRTGSLSVAALALLCAVTPVTGAVAAPASARPTPPSSTADPAAAAIAAGGGSASTPAPPRQSAAEIAADARLTRQLRARTDGPVRIDRHARTGEVRFVGTAPGAPVPRAPGLPAGAPAERSARAFLDGYGRLFGVRDEGSELRLVARHGGAHKTTAVHFQQTHRGVPVIGGELVVTVDAAGNTVSANGETSSDLALGTTPRLASPAAERIARGLAAKSHSVPAAGLRTKAPVLSVYDPALLGAPGPRLRSLVWRTEVQSPDAQIRELVLVDAATGAVRLHVDENPEAKQRSVCDARNVRSASDACTAPIRTEGGPATGLQDADLAYDYAGVTYDFYRTLFGRDSLDGRGLPLKSTVRYCPEDLDTGCPFQNAYWNGTQMVYGQSYASADDVVAHELTHGVTDFTSQLFYYYQSGAINESFSDVFGELVDLTDGQGNDSAAVRWEIGEDLPDGAIRDMMDPGRFQQPDRMTSALYTADPLDAGGVHTDSGVGNKAAALLVDGGTFNGQTVRALGIDKVARVYYEAGTRLMTSATDYADLFDILPQACANLVGTHAITAADCTSVRAAVTATEMNKQPPVAAVPEAPICATGQVRTDILADDLEHPATGNWTTAARAGYGWAYPQSNSNPDYGGFDPVYATSGRTEMWGDDPDTASDATITTTRAYAVPRGSKTYLRFAHAYGFEAFSPTETYDGGRVEYSTDGTTWLDAGRFAVDGGYTATSVAALGNKPGYGGDSGGYRTSRFDLSSLAGTAVRFRFRVASDSNGGGYGWFIDDVNLYSCAPPQPVLRIGDAVVKEGPAGRTATATFPVTRSSGSGTASVRFATAAGSATSGVDFTARALSTLSFAAGETRKNVAVTVLGDAVPEAHETFSLRLSSPVGATLADASGTGTITDDDAGLPARLSVSDPVVVEGNPGGTTQAVFTISNSGTTLEPVTVTYSTLAGTAGSGDFQSLPPTTVTLPAGVASARVAVPIVGDTTDEANETFSLVLSKASRATISDASGTATIVDDEGPRVAGPATFYRLSDVRIAEGAAGVTRSAVVTITRSGVTSGAGSVVVETRGGSATPGVDYTPVAPTTVAFAAGQTSATVAVQVLGDDIPEQHESVQLRATSAVGGVLADDTAVVVLGDTDLGDPARLTVDDVAVREGGSGAVNATFTVTRSGTSTEPVTVTWATAAATAPYSAATAGGDYVPQPATSLVLAAGETSKRVSVRIVPDSGFEANESFLVTLTGALGAAVSDGTAVGTILDDD